jgi:protein transport protein DSL1/ZW10
MHIYFLEQDASLSSARVAKEFCFAARDVLLLYRAIVPVQVRVCTNFE